MSDEELPPRLGRRHRSLQTAHHVGRRLDSKDLYRVALLRKVAAGGDGDLMLARGVAAKAGILMTVVAGTRAETIAAVAASPKTRPAAGRCS